MHADTPVLTRPDDTLDRALQLLFATGEPVAVSRLADELGQGVDAVRETLARFERMGRVRFAGADSAGGDTRGDTGGGSIVACTGVSVVPSDYELRVGSRLRWAWCAKTGLGVLGALAAGGSLTTRDADGPLTVEFDGGTPVPGTLAVLWPSERFQSGCRSAADELCATFSLFRDAAAAREWAAARNVEAEVLTPDEATNRTVDRYRHSLGLPATRRELLGR